MIDPFGRSTVSI